MTQFLMRNAILTACSVAAFTAASAAPAMAAATPVAGLSNAVSLSSEAFIERTEIAADGKETSVLKRPQDVVVVPGDRVLFKLAYANKGSDAATDFRAVNPMPAPVRFVSAAEDWAEVSVDGGKSWGRLETLTVAVPAAEGVAAGTRAATPEDVTHVRWVFKAPIAPGASGTLSYQGVIK